MKRINCIDGCGEESRGVCEGRREGERGRGCNTYVKQARHKAVCILNVLRVDSPNVI